MSPLFVSLGSDCRVKYQIFREQVCGEGLAKTPAEVNKLLYASNHRGDAGTFFFDWLVTPTAGLLKTIADNFDNVFERADLEISASGNVQNQRNGITFQHNFSRGSDGRVTQDIIEKEYEQQREKIEYLKSKTVSLAASDRKVSYVRVGGTDQELESLSALLSAKFPSHDFSILAVRMINEPGREFQTLSKTIDVYTMNNINEKPPAAQWQGDDTRWSMLFRDLADHLGGGERSTDNGMRPHASA